MIGTQRGGTKIAGRLIGQLTGFAFLGELRKLWQVGLPEGRRCGCGQSYASCPVWSAVLARVGGDADVATLQQWQEAAAPDRRSSVQAWRLARHQRPTLELRVPPPPTAAGPARDPFVGSARAARATIR